MLTSKMMRSYIRSSFSSNNTSIISKTFGNFYGRYFSSSVSKYVENVVIMGAAGRDFHNFNTYYRNNDSFNVVAFTAAQIPDIDGRRYPFELSGHKYPNGIPIISEDEFTKEWIKTHEIDKVIFSYSDISHQDLMHKASRALAGEADFSILGPHKTQLRSSKPVISVVASRTGCGKSQTTKQIMKNYTKLGYKVVAVRHPMPYGDLRKQICQRFATYEDLDKHECTIEEREEYEPYIDLGGIVYSGVDYEVILHEVEKEADLILWDGGNNDWSFYKPDIQVCVVDPHRAGHSQLYFPGEVNVRHSDIILINKIDTAGLDQINTCRSVIKDLNPKAIICESASPIYVDNYDQIRNKKVICVEDGPTITHGGMTIGAATIAANRFGCKEIIDPHLYAVGEIKETYRKYPHVQNVLPAMGYSEQQIKDLKETLDNSDADIILTGTPIDLNRVLKTNKPIVRVKYDLDPVGQPNFHRILYEKLRELDVSYLELD